ncbi:hypothetical protein ACQJBY_022676 [Aegilops geniculata]
MADQKVSQLGPGAACCGWNHCGRRLAAGAVDGSVSVYDSQPSPSSKWQAHEHAIVAVVWLPPDYGDAIACVCADGTLSLWEEIAEDDQLPIWRKCKVFEGGSSHILNVQFGLLLSSLKMVIAYSDGQVKVYELLDSLELDKWQLQSYRILPILFPELGSQHAFLHQLHGVQEEVKASRLVLLLVSIRILQTLTLARFGSLKKLTSAGFHLLNLVHRRIRGREYML